MEDNKKRDDKLGALYEIAYMYYVLDMSQREIAKRAFLSRPHISRLLKQAKDEGIVEIKLNYFGERSHCAEKSLRAEFGLAEAYVYNCKDIPADERHNAVSRYAARYLESRLRVGQSLGITRGSILASIICSMRPGAKLNLRVVQLMGAEALDHRNSAPDLIRKLVEIFSGASVYLDAPLYVENDAARNNLIREPFLRKELQEAKNVDAVLTSIRPLYRGMKNHIWTGFVDDAVIDELIRAGAVGYLLGRAFDIAGKLVDHPLNRRIIGLHPDELRSKWTIGVAYDSKEAAGERAPPRQGATRRSPTRSEHAQAMHGVLRGGYLKALITDFDCANAILSLVG